MRQHLAPKTIPLAYHADHEVEIHLYTGPKHTAYYKCKNCNKFVSWLSRQETDQALRLGLINDL